MKPQNFYNFLDENSVCAEIILSYCEDIKELEEGLVLYFKDKKNTNRRTHVNMQILGVKSKEDLAEKQEEEVEERKKTIENISKFISFMKKEDEELLKIMDSEEFTEWIDKEDNMEEDYFEEIDCIPAYIHKNSGVMVGDLVKTFEHIKRLIETDIEEIIGVSFPIQGNLTQMVLVQNVIRKKNIVVDEATREELGHLIITHDDFDFLIDAIKKDIEELEEPIKL